MKLATASGMKNADRYAIETLGISSLGLMERAAEALLAEAERLTGGLEGINAAVFCGAGNNGGDGFALARLLEGAGAAVRVALVGSPEKMTPDCARMAALYGKPPLTDIPKALEGCTLIVDAMSGIGLRSALRGAAEEAARAINSAKAAGGDKIFVLAADIPSGVDADTGNVPGEAVRADATVTFSMGKPGLYVQPGCAFCGEIKTAGIGIPESVLEKAACGASVVEENETAALLPRRDPLGHKGDFGRALLICGSPGFTGAAWLSSEMAARSGAGLVHLACFPKIWPILAEKCTEAMPFPMYMGIEDVLPVLEKADACLVGCGLGQGGRAERLFAALLKSCACPLVIDADGINLLSRNIDLLKTACCPVILTPHDGEFARLGGELKDGRMAGAAALAERTGALVVLKGHRTVTAAPDGRCWINSTGCSGLAKGGSGDVLAGLITGLLAQGMAPEEAARAAVWLHGRAGEVCARELGERFMTPSDVIRAVGAVMKNL